MWSGVTDASGRRGCESCLPCNASVSLKLFQDKRNVKEATSASIGRWMNEGGVCVCVCGQMECHSATKKNEIMPFAAAWMDLEMVKLSKPDREKNIV